MAHHHCQTGHRPTFRLRNRISPGRLLPDRHKAGNGHGAGPLRAYYRRI